MPIIFIGSVPFGGGEKLARSLAQKLGYSFLSREDVVARANECGIPVGKLEVAMVKKPSVQERLARLKDRYLAVATAAICEKAAEGGLVYYGRAGHHLLPGVSHVLRIHIVPEHNQRLANVVERLKLDREKSEEFLKNVDSDIEAWVHFVHGVELNDAARYDFIVNLENLSIENAATALCGIAGLPDFQPTPASRKAMEDRLLQSRARIKLALDERTANANLTVRARDGIVTITYMPRQSEVAKSIPVILDNLPECRQIRCTMASTNILWIQEEFRKDSESFKNINELARRWGAAIELVRYRPEGGEESRETAPAPLALRTSNGGVEDDVPETETAVDPSFKETLEVLVHEGRSGGGHTVCGTRDRLLASLNPDIPYSLVAVGDLFLQKPSAARTRLKRDLSGYLAKHFKAPVIATEDLGKRLRFGPKQAVKVAAALVVVIAVYFLLFSNQEAVMDVLGGDSHSRNPWIAPVLITLVAPLVAALYGLIAGALLKLVKLE